jgi:hypothetical protein
MAEQYPNRSDLRSPISQVAEGQTYGMAKQQQDAMRAAPVGKSPVEVDKPVIIPGSLGSFARPTERPNEPITAGVDYGPGPGSIEANVNLVRSERNNAMDEIKAIYQAFPSEELGMLIQFYETME